MIIMEIYQNLNSMEIYIFLINGNNRYAGEL